MPRHTVRYARNGALAAIAFYLVITVPLLGLSLHANDNAAQQPSAALTPVGSPTAKVS